MVLYRTQRLFACLNGSLHGEMFLQIDGECVVYGSTIKCSAIAKMSRRTLFGAI